MKNKLFTNLALSIRNYPGWKTKRRILVIESDDWGSIRMPSNDVFQNFLNYGLDMKNSKYNRLDSIESNDDLNALFEVLRKFKDYNGAYPIITANTIVANPDFRKIKDTGYSKYYYESVLETLNKYPNRNKVKELWFQGLNEKVYYPQYHGREHVNITRWMNQLKVGNPKVIYTFNYGTTFSGENDYNYMEVLDYNSPEEIVEMKKGIKEGLQLFEKIFGYKSRSFIPPCYTWDSKIEEELYVNDVKYIQGAFVQAIPTGEFGQYRKKYHFLGTRNSYDQVYLVRNCSFEPALSNMSDPVSNCLNQIKLAFKRNKPAIISSHRINYMGSLVEKNRNDNLVLLSELINRILKNWSDVEFMTSDQLGDLIANSHKSL